MMSNFRAAPPKQKERYFRIPDFFTKLFPESKSVIRSPFFAAPERGEFPAGKNFQLEGEKRALAVGHMLY
jgi:hypothetical protein